MLIENLDRNIFVEALKFMTHARLVRNVDIAITPTKIFFNSVPTKEYPHNRLKISCINMGSKGIMVFNVGDNLYNFLSNCKDKFFSIEEEPGYQLRVTCGGNSLDFYNDKNISDADKIIKEDFIISLKGGKVIETIKKAMNFVDKFYISDLHGCVNFSFSDKVLRITGTDKHVLCSTTIDIDESLSGNFSVFWKNLLPLTNIKQAEAITLFQTKTQDLGFKIKTKNLDIYYITPVHPEKYPGITFILKRDVNPLILSITPKDLYRQLKLLNLDVKNRVYLHYKDGLVISCVDISTKSEVTVVKGKHAGVVYIPFNKHYLMDIIRSLNDKTVLMSVEENTTRPLKIVSKDSTYILMPLGPERTSEEEEEDGF